MAWIVLSAALACGGALLLGQAVLRLCGAREWSWFAAPVGISVAILLATPTVHLPGRAGTTAVILAVATIAAAIYVLRDRAMHPPVLDVLAAFPVGMLTLVPFLAAGREGTLGISFNNDMASHLIWAEAIRSEQVEAVTPLPGFYPLGPHGLAAALSEGLGADLELVFAGLTAAACVLLGWTALGLLRDAPWPARFVVAPLVGMPFLVAAYFGQSSFKELIQATLVLGVAAGINTQAPWRGPLGRFVPYVVIAGGSISTYSVTGLPWLAGIGGGAIALALWTLWTHEGRPAVVSTVRAHALPAAMATGLLVVCVLPQISDVADFASESASGGGTPIDEGSLGNLAGRLPLSEALGVWDVADYRLPAGNTLDQDLWGAYAAILVVGGLALLIRRRLLILPLAAVVAFVIWVYADNSESPYVAAKGLMLLTPLLLAAACVPLVERVRGEDRRARLLPYAGIAACAVLIVGVIGSSADALRASFVGPTDHRDELRSLRSTLDGKRTLFLGFDDFAGYALAGVPVSAPGAGGSSDPFSEDKPSSYGQAIDVDTVDESLINQHRWLITTRDAAASEPHPELELVRRTRSFALYRRTATLEPRRTLPEGDLGTARLNCDSRRGRRILRGGGVASVRPESIGHPLPAIPPGTSTGVTLDLPPGTYDLSMPYTGPRELLFQVVGQYEIRLPANLDRPGPRLPVGRMRSDGRPVTVGMYATKERLTPVTAITNPVTLVTTRVVPSRTVPVREACGEHIDWYRPASSS